MPTLTSADHFLPTQIMNGIVSKAVTGSTVAALSSAEPMRFGKADIVTFNETLTAEFIEEGAPKGSTSAKPAHVTALPHKAVVNFRTSDEFKIADEDYQLGILDELEQKCADALARALDLGLYHRINPRTGNVISGWSNYLTSTTNKVVAGAEPDKDIETAVGMVIGTGYRPNGIALDSSYAWTLSTARFADGRKKYPELGFGVDITNFEGLKASVSSTVSGAEATTATKVLGIVGDFDQGIRWGVQKNFPFRMLEFGDPDNSGRDLAGHNEILFRTEVILAWYVFPEMFAQVTKP